jgi:hypothetical protein
MGPGGLEKSIGNPLTVELQKTNARRFPMRKNGATKQDVRFIAKNLKSLVGENEMADLARSTGFLRRKYQLISRRSDTEIADEGCHSAKI